MKNEVPLTQDVNATNSVGEPLSAVSVEVPVGRRRFTQAEKIAILEKFDRCERGSRGTFLRQSGLYSSVVYSWRKEFQSGAGLVPQKRGKKSQGTTSMAAEMVKLRRQLAASEERNRQMQLIIDVQKKVSQILGVTLPEVAL